MEDFGEITDVTAISITGSLDITKHKSISKRTKVNSTENLAGNED